MVGSDKSRGYCLEMICADSLAGANLDNGNPEDLLYSMTRFFKLPPGEQKHAFLAQLPPQGIMNSIRPKRPDGMGMTTVNHAEGFLSGTTGGASAPGHARTASSS
jgi:hypothetical protein